MEWFPHSAGAQGVDVFCAVIVIGLATGKHIEQ
jgi:hypothetical protein